MRRNMEDNSQQLQLTSSEDDITENNNDIHTIEGDAYGDCIKLQPKSDNLRIGFININSIPSSNQHEKNDELRHAINEYGIDILGMAEINQNWYKIEDSKRWRQRTQHWWEAVHHSESFNQHDVSPSSFQPGGVSLMSFNKTAHRVIGKDVDPTGQGRWCYSTYRGKNNIKLRVVSLY